MQVYGAELHLEVLSSQKINPGPVVSAESLAFVSFADL